MVTVRLSTKRGFLIVHRRFSGCPALRVSRTVSHEIALIIPFPGMIDKKSLVLGSFPNGCYLVCDLKADVWSGPV